MRILAQNMNPSRWRGGQASKRPRPAVWPFLRVIGLRISVGRSRGSRVRLDIHRRTAQCVSRQASAQSQRSQSVVVLRSPERSASAISCSRTSCFGQVDKAGTALLILPSLHSSPSLLSRTCCGRCGDWWSFDEMATGLPFPVQSPYRRASTWCRRVELAEASTRDIRQLLAHC